MTTGAGFKTTAAWARENKSSAYGTAATCGANQVLPMVTEDVQGSVEKVHDEAIRNKAGLGAATVVSRQVGGPLALRMTYRGLEAVLVAALGLCPYTGPTTVAAGVYRHNFIPDEDLAREGWGAGDGVLAGSGLLAGDQKVRAGTFCVDKSISVWENASVMVRGLTIKGDSKGVFLDLDLVAREQLRGTLTNPDSSTWTIPGDDFLPVLFGDLALWLGDYSTTTPLTSGNAVGISSFEIKLDNKLKTEQDSTSGLSIAEPGRDGRRQVTVTLRLPRYENDDFLDALDAGTPKMAMLKFTGSALGSTGYNRALWIWLPRFTLDRAPAPTGGPGLLQMQIDFTAELPPALPSGFPTTATKEILLQLQNDYPTNPLK